ncbi:MAG: peptide chain release factor N(5)-glutamine methyltransferase [Pyrinomonadaceae bacterium]|nr:peptide chain release factor N(5)-glutamine methyltransferase [Blastocatellia bacterium]MCW5957230.1 peptide chain release factor N(5)-glutamine methyltransferase [Pyrinomonadaceae bacterium]
MNIADAKSTGANRLAESGVPEPVREASLILAFALGKDAAFLYAHPEYELNVDETIRYGNAIERRSAREPLQYIVGIQEFYRHDFLVTPAVLIPRPETEMIVSKSIEFLSGRSSPRFLDVGTGSGCIAISILKHVPGASAVAVDISAEALKVAAKNADTHGVNEELELKVSDVYSQVGNEQFDLIVSNPPYIPAEDIEGLQPEVRDHEPLGALTDGGVGTAVIDRVIKGAFERLTSGGLLLVEIGIGQDQTVLKAAKTEEWASTGIERDFQGIPRTLVFKRS